MAGDRRSLRKEAAVALEAEMARRGLTHEHARAQRRSLIRQEMDELRPRHSKRRASKYFEYQLNLQMVFIGFLGFLPLAFYAADHRQFSDEWFFSVWIVYLGILIMCAAVRPWVRQTVSFWVCLAISCVPQFWVSHWLTVHHPSDSRSGLKGAAFASLLAGWALGGALFLLAQKVWPRGDADVVEDDAE